MTIVYDLWFGREYPDREDTELHIGIYANQDDAAKAISLLRDQPGFRDFPEGFTIYPVRLGATSWQQGFEAIWISVEKGDAVERPA